MSLKVWLPLDGDLRNLGTSNYEISIFRGTEIYNNNGKIGKCFYSNGVNTLKIINIIPDVYNYSAYSLSAWCYVEAQNTVHSGSAIISAGNWNNQLLNLSMSDWSSDHYTKLRISGTNWNRTYNYNFYKNIWYHIVVCDDGQYTYGYVNGTLIGNTASSFLPTTIQGNDMCIGGATYYNGMQFFGKINDVRIYDHCLSAAEVHELAQGLVLHYKLEGPMGGSGINLLQGANKIGGSNSYGWIKNGNGYSDFIIEKLENNILHYKGTISNSKYIPTITTKTVAPCEFGKTYTYQMELKFDKDVTLTNSAPMHFWTGCRNTDDITNVNCNGNLTGITYSYVQNHSGTLTANTWVKIITRFTFPSAATTTGYDYPAIRPFVYGSILPEAYTGEINVWMRNCKIEEGTVATNWSPALEDLGIDTTIVEDSSGYNNNGIAMNTPCTVTETKRYSSALRLNGSNQYVNCGKGAKVTDAITVAVWAYMDDWSTYNARTFSCTNTGGWYLGINGDRPSFLIGFGENSNTYTRVNATTPYSQLSSGWHHFAVTYDGYYTKIYIDGELNTTGTTVQSVKTPIFYDSDNSIMLGAEAGSANLPEGEYYFNGILSDFRIYCTPLLDTDIKLLYNTGMRLDNFNNIHTYEINENDIFTPKLLKTGVLKGKTFIENCMAEMPDGDSFGYTPAANQDGRNSSTISILFPYFKHCGHKLRATIELDATWTKFTAGTGGTFALYFQGPRVNIETDAVEWTGQAMITSSLPKLTSKVLESAGSEHIKVTTDINASFFDTHYGQKIGLRCNFSDGTGHIDISNVKVYIDYPSAKIHSKYIVENNIIEF